MCNLTLNVAEVNHCVRGKKLQDKFCEDTKSVLANLRILANRELLEISLIEFLKSCAVVCSLIQSPAVLCSRMLASLLKMSVRQTSTF